MHRSVFVFAGAVLVLVGLAAYAGRATAPAPAAGQPAHDADALAERYGFAIGYDMGSRGIKGIEADGVQYDPEALLRGFSEAVRKEGPSMLTLDEITLTLQDLESEVRTRIAEERYENDPVFRALADQNMQESQAFLERFAAEPGVKKTENGQSYKVIESGSGPQAQMGDIITASYRGVLRNGYEWAEDAHARIRISRLLRGGGKILKRMRVGDHWVVAIPPELGFGLGGRDPDIGPNEVLILQIHLLDVEKPGG